MRLTALLAVLLLVGCDRAYTSGEPEWTEVRGVQCEKRGGQADCITVVQFPDGSVRNRVGWWGERGDSLLAVRGNNYGSWLSPKEPQP